MSESDLLNGKYRLDQLIGRGGFGEVYRATDLTLQRQVAVKLIKDSISNDSSVSARFLKEARLTSQLKHPNTLTIYDFGKHQGQLFLVSELLDGENLRARLCRVKHLQPHEMISLFVPICKALHEAHLAGVIHRDLKPDNLFLHNIFDEDKMVLLDFGIAKTINNNTHVTQTGHYMGTPHYMAPEQIRESKSVGHTADIYSLGIIFFEVLSSAEPYQGDSLFDIFERHITAEIPKLDELVSSELMPFDTLITSMLAKNPLDRPQSALEIAERLIQIKDKVPATLVLSHLLPRSTPINSQSTTLSNSYLQPSSSLHETYVQETLADPHADPINISIDSITEVHSVGEPYVDLTSVQSAPHLREEDQGAQRSEGRLRQDHSLGEHNRTRSRIVYVTLIVCPLFVWIVWILSYDLNSNHDPQSQNVNSSRSDSNHIPVVSATQELKSDQASHPDTHSRAQVRVTAVKSVAVKSVKKRETRRNTRRKEVIKNTPRAHSKSGVDLQLKLEPLLAHYPIGSKTKLYAHFSSSLSSRKRFTIKLRPRKLGKVKNFKTSLNQNKTYLLGEIEWSLAGRGYVRICLGKQCTSETVVIDNLNDADIPKKINADGVNFDQLD